MARRSGNQLKPKVSEYLWMLVIALIGAVLVAGAGAISFLRVGSPLRYLSYDIPFLVHRAEVPDQIRIVHIDKLNGDVLDRTSQPELLDRLGEAGARVVVYDVVFNESEPVDPAFAAAIRRFRGVDEQGEAVPGATRRTVLLACWREDLEQSGLHVEKLIIANKELQRAADDWGLVSFVGDEHFVVRELIGGTRDEPSLAWKAALAAGAPLDESRRADARWINYVGPPTRMEGNRAASAIFSCSVSDVLNGSVSELFLDKIVVVGGRPGILGSEPGQPDVFSSPYKRFDRVGRVPPLSGVQLQANAVANYLQGNWLVRTSDRVELYMLVGAGIVAGAGFTRLRPVRALSLAIVLMLALVVAGIATVHYSRFWFPWSVIAFLQIPLASTWGTGARFYFERFARLRLTAQQRQLYEAFSKYLSPQMLQKLIDDDFAMAPGGEVADVAMMFTDLEDFTKASEAVGDAELMVRALNGYFERTTRHIFEHDGVIIKYIGDAIFAEWGAPRPDPQAASHALRAAWGLSRSQRLEVKDFRLRTRIGLHCGEVVAGHIGSERRLDYTMIGDPVNLAARLEGLNKMFGTKILLSGPMRQRAGEGFLFRKVGMFKVKGREEVTEVHELLGLADEDELPHWVATYERGLIALVAGDKAAAADSFRSTERERGGEGDGPSRFFIDAIDGGDDLTDGICKLTEK